MTIKTLLFLLVLYICLVWVGAAYLHPESDFRDFGLKWTLIGLIGVIAFVVGNHLLGWWRLWRAKPARREKPASKPAPIVHEDDTALAAALAEANATLAKAPDYMNQRRPLYRLPWRLIIGPAGSGKTSLLVNSGLEPQLLAGHARETETAASTRLCNIWLAKNTIFIELAGRFFDGDIARWNQLLRVMRGTESVPLWKRLLGQREQTGTLRGVIACSDLRQFTGAKVRELGNRPIACCRLDERFPFRFIRCSDEIGPPKDAAPRRETAKMHLIRQDHRDAPPLKLPLPRIINLLTDLKEDRDVLTPSGWVTYPMMKILRDFEASLETYPPIKVGTPDPYTPPASTGRRDGSGTKP